MDISPLSTSSSEKEGQNQSDLRKLVLIEFLIFLILGFTSFLSLIFLPTTFSIYTIYAIAYGIILIIGGGLGLYSNYKVIVKIVRVSLGFLILIGLVNLLAIGVYCILFVENINKGMPDCNGNCSFDHFWYVAHTGYFLFEILFSIFLTIFSGIAFKHTLLYLKRERELPLDKF